MTFLAFFNIYPTGSMWHVQFAWYQIMTKTLSHINLIRFHPTKRLYNEIFNLDS